MPWIILLGFTTGLRSMTPIAVVCWFCWLGQLPVQGTWASWSASLVSVVLFTLLALGEYIADTLPQAPNRTALVPAIARVVLGALVGAILATAYLSPVAGGILFGGAGALIGTWSGFGVRRFCSRRAGRDLPVALLESAATLFLSVMAARAYHADMLTHPAVYAAALLQLDR